MAEEKTDIEEVIVAERQSLEYKAKDADLIVAIDTAVKEAKPLKEYVDKIGKRNETYWEKGTEVDPKKIHPTRAKITVNRIFMSVETILPMLTSRTPEPMIGGEITNDIREKLIKALTIAYEVKQKVQQELQKIIRHWFLYRIGVWKYRWDEGFVLETVLPSKIGIDPRGTEDIKNCEFMYEQMEDTIEDLILKFPKKKKELTDKYAKDRMKSKVGYIEFWGGKGEWVAWKLGNMLLEKKKNPNFDYTEDNNLFKKPQFPYLILNVFNLGKNLYDDSVTPDTPILIRRYGKFLDIIPIEELTPNYRENTGYWEKYRHVDQNIEVLTKEKKWSKIAYVYRHKVKKDIYTIVTGEGVTKVTGDHSLFQDNKEIKVKDLKEKDRIDVVDFDFQNDFSEITKEYAYALGFFVAEGWANGVKFGAKGNGWSISQKTPEKLEKIKNVLEEAWNQSFVIRESNGMYTLNSIGWREDLVNWFRKNCYTRSGEKRVPIQILNSDKDIKRAFLEGYWDGDGFGHIADGEAKCSTKSFVLASGVSYLLRCLGYKSGIYCRQDKESNFEIKIIRSFRRNFQSNEVKNIYCRKNDGFVYDIETADESHSFVAGVGYIVHHNSSLIEQVIPLQDSVNKRKNQISDLTDENKKLITASSRAISKEEFQKFINKYGMLGLWLDNGEITDIRTEGGVADAATFNDLSHSISEIDNIMGTHSTTRGERKEQETLGGRRLLTGADYGRIDTIIIRIEQLMENFYNAHLHMIKVYSTEDAVFSDGEETVKVNRDEIPTGIMAIVKKGSTLPVDKAARAEMAVKLAQFGFIDPKTLFEELGYGDEEQRTQDLFQWLALTGKIQPQQPTGGQGATKGGGGREGATQSAQLARLREIMSSKKFKALSDEQKQIIISKAREITQAIKGGKR